MAKDGVPQQKYFEALLEEKDRALSMAADEREKAADVLRQEQHRALTVAESEREKSAQALAHSLARSIQEGDDRLREHISNQVQQIKSSLVSAELLEVERIRGAVEALDEKINANTREFKQIQESQKEAVTKAETASEKRFDSVNEFRATLRDQQADLLPRKEYDVAHRDLIRQVDELRKNVATLHTDIAVGPAGLGTLEGRITRSEGRSEGSHAVTAALISVAGIILVAAGVIATILTSHP